MTEQQKQNNYKLADLLESGEIAQTQGQLRKGEAMCCMGVACELYSRETGNGKWMNNNSFFLPKSRKSDEQYSVGNPPEEVREFYGWRSTSPTLPAKIDGKEEHSSRIAAFALNDMYRFTFPQIAQCLRNMVEGESND